MIITGADYHPGFQQIAAVKSEALLARSGASTSGFFRSLPNDTMLRLPPSQLAVARDYALARRRDPPHSISNSAVRTSATLPFESMAFTSTR